MGCKVSRNTELEIEVEQEPPDIIAEIGRKYRLPTEENIRDEEIHRHTA